MENNKYYQPTIEEFHVGFEFEELNSGKWNKVKLTSGRHLDQGVVLKKYADCVEVNVRVKYLDKEDIENEGWSCNIVSNRRTIGHKYIGLEKLEDGLWCDSKLSITVRNNFYSKIPHITIREYEIHDPEEELSVQQIDKIENQTIFRGYIKNASELKKILKQLNV